MNNPPTDLTGMDLVQWLDNKLGNPNELWCGRQAATFLSRDVLNELSTCFQALEPQVKLKIIEAIPYLSSKLVQMWREPLNKLLSVAKNDADHWIHTVAKFYTNYPNSCAITCDISALDKQFAEAVVDFQKILDKSIPELECNVIPPDCLIVTPAATQMAFGYSTTEPKKHFTVKGSLKADQMMQEALKLAQSSQNNLVKRSAPKVASASLPIKVRSTIRKPDNVLPMRGIPSIPVSRISSGFSNEPRKFQRNVPNRAGGAMLIDISDLPQAPAIKKKRGGAAAAATIAKQGKIDGEAEVNPKKRGRKGKSQESFDEEEATHPFESQEQQGERPTPSSYSFKPINFQRASIDTEASSATTPSFNSNPFAPSPDSISTPSFNPFAPTAMSNQPFSPSNQPFSSSPPFSSSSQSFSLNHQPFAPSNQQQHQFSSNQPFASTNQQHQFSSNQPFAPSSMGQPVMPARKLDNNLIDGPFSFI